MTDPTQNNDSQNGEPEVDSPIPTPPEQASFDTPPEVEMPSQSADTPPPGPSFEEAAYTETEPEAEPAPEPAKTACNNAEDLFKSGVAKAKERLEETLEEKFPSLKDDVEKGFNDVSYAVGYAMEFGRTLVREFSPPQVQEGFDRGKEAGAKAADEVVKHRKAKQAEPSSEEEPEPSTTG